MAKLFAVGACTVLTAADAVSPDAEAKFMEFESRFGKNYAADERMHRLSTFAENLEIIEALQQSERGTAVYSHLTPFADLSPTEFSRRKGFAGARSGVRRTSPRQAELPGSFDWREKGYSTPVKDQGQCGSCWAFATVANIEGAGFVSTNQLLSLSEQQLVDCDKDEDEGCNGGLPESAYKYMIAHNMGLERESDYAYSGRDGACKADASKETAFVGDWTDLSQDEDEIAAALMQYGPLALGINAGPMQFYAGGVAQPSAATCRPEDLDHGVTFVAFGEDSGTPYWTIRNSWGSMWGEAGHYRIVRGAGACGLNTAVTTALNVTIGAAPPSPPTPPAPTPPPPAPTPPSSCDLSALIIDCDEARTDGGPSVCRGCLFAYDEDVQASGCTDEEVDDWCASAESSVSV